MLGNDERERTHHRKFGGVVTAANMKNWKTGTQSIVKAFCASTSAQSDA